MDIRVYDFKVMGDDRGSLLAVEGNMDIPFDIKRIYYIFAVQQGMRRGCHAHRELKQVLICVSGSCKILLDDGRTKETVLLDSPSRGLLIDKMLWREMYDFSPDAVLLVLASEHYSESDYVRDYDRFLDIVNGRVG